VAAGTSPGELEGLVACRARIAAPVGCLDRTVYPISGSGLQRFSLEDRCAQEPPDAHSDIGTKEVLRMRAKIMSWKHLLYTVAALATLALAAGARYKPQ
jgi:hypothetical protein